MIPVLILLESFIKVNDTPAEFVTSCENEYNSRVCVNQVEQCLCDTQLCFEGNVVDQNGISVIFDMLNGGRSSIFSLLRVDLSFPADINILM